MELSELLQLINKYFPERAVEIAETLGLLRDTIEDTREDIKKRIIELYDKGDHQSIEPHVRMGTILLEYINQIQQIQAYWNQMNQYKTVL